MIGIYFSGTGNSKHCVERFLEAYGKGGKAFSIEDETALYRIREQDEIVMRDRKSVV